MLRAVTLGFSLAALVATIGCKQEFRAFEGQGCSNKSDDDPLYTCTPQFDLLCIATHAQPITKDKLAAKFDGGARDVYVCRVPCAPDAGTSQCGSDEVCCLGRVYGKKYADKPGGCVRAEFCDNLPPQPDGAPRPTPDARVGGMDATADGATDAPVDGAPAGSDAVVDAVSN